MKIVIKELKNASLVEVSGRIDSDTSPEVAQAFQSIQEASQYNLIVDMAGLEYVSSATLRALMAAQRNSRRGQRGEVVLMRVPPKIYGILEMAGLVELFRIVDDLASLPEMTSDPATSAEPGGQDSEGSSGS